MSENTSPRGANLPPGYDEEDPYKDEDLSEYPAWWRRNVELFREHGMRPYRPPRFIDGVHTPELIKTLESKLGIEIQLRAINPQEGNKWELIIDGNLVKTVDRRREGEGYSQYEITSNEFETLVREQVEG